MGEAVGGGERATRPRRAGCATIFGFSAAATPVTAKGREIMEANDLDDLKQQLRVFAHDRDWDKFHSPKNLSMALAVEAAELMEHFQWLDEAQSRQLPPQTHQAVGEELADVMLYLVRLADIVGVDLVAAAQAKIRINASKYPADVVRGRADKYDKY